WIESKPQITEIGSRHCPNIGRLPRLVEPRKRLLGVALLINGKQVLRRRDPLSRPEVKRFQDPSSNGDELRGETEFRFLKAGNPQYFRNVSVIENRINRKILSDFAEAGLKRRLASSPTDAALGVAHHAKFTRHCVPFQKRPQSQIGRRGVAAWI